MKRYKKRMTSSTLQQLKDIRRKLKQSLPPADYYAFNQIYRNLLDPCAANSTDLRKYYQQIAKYVDAVNSGKQQPFGYMIRICLMVRIKHHFCLGLADYTKEINIQNYPHI